LMTQIDLRERLEELDQADVAGRESLTEEIQRALQGESRPIRKWPGHGYVPRGGTSGGRRCATSPSC
jgi:hypothetical protein